MDYKIPLFDLNFGYEEEKAVTDVLRSKWISMGPKCFEFEDLISKMLNIKYALSLSSCTASLHLAMKILGITKGDEVICPSLTFVATANCIRYVDATPVFADVVSYDNLTIDPIDIEKKITKKTKAIIVMHYGGFACNMEVIMEIAKKYKLKVVEDASHAPLAEYKGRKLGTIGDIGCFSFFSNKNVSTGEGGMLVTNNSEYYERAKLLRSHGMTSLSYERSKGHSTSYDVVDLGYNYRMDDIRASIGIVQLNKLKFDIVKRTEVRNMYIEELSSINEIIIPFQDYQGLSSNYIFPIVLRDSNNNKRDNVRNALSNSGIQTSVHYPAIHRFLGFEKYFSELRITDYVNNNLITLPMYSSLNFDIIKYISKKVSESIQQE